MCISWPCQKVNNNNDNNNNNSSKNTNNSELIIQLVNKNPKKESHKVEKSNKK